MGGITQGTSSAMRGITQGTSSARRESHRTRPSPPFPVGQDPSAFPEPPAVPMNPITTHRGGADISETVTYSTPFTVAQLAEIARKDIVFKPAADQFAFFDSLRQQAVLQGLDEAEQVKLCVMCLSPALQSALPDPQNVEEGTLEEMKDAILTAIGYNKGDPVEGLNRCRQHKGEHPITFASRLWIHFQNVFLEITEKTLR